MKLSLPQHRILLSLLAEDVNYDFPGQVLFSTEEINDLLKERLISFEGSITSEGVAAVKNSEHLKEITKEVLSLHRAELLELAGSGDDMSEEAKSVLKILL